MSRKVLIADDYDDVRSMLKTALELSGFEALEARNGYEAVMTAYQQHPDLILMDMSMPVLDGLNAVRAIREFDNDDAKVPIVAVTADAGFYKKRALDAGCDAVIEKPVFMDELQPYLDIVLEP
jgi:two-component system, cell cycle response regulator DivK